MALNFPKPSIILKGPWLGYVRSIAWSHRPPKFERAAFQALFRKSMSDPTDGSQNKPTYQRQQRCSACKGQHNVKQCRNLFEELRPDGWLVHEPQERRCQKYLKTPEGRALYHEQKKHYAVHLPEKTSLKPTSRKRKATEDPESPQLSSAWGPCQSKTESNQHIPKRTIQQQKTWWCCSPNHSTKTPRTLEQGETPEQNPNQGWTPPIMLTSSLGGGGDKPFHINPGGANNPLDFSLNLTFFPYRSFFWWSIILWFFIGTHVHYVGTLFPGWPFFLIEGFWRLEVFNEA
jgi:hypothetical protein